MPDTAENIARSATGQETDDSPIVDPDALDAAGEDDAGEADGGADSGAAGSEGSE